MTPLITAAEGFCALERLVADAEAELLLSFRILDPKTRLRDPDLIEHGLETWADLIGWVQRRGVKLRLLMADFDPLFSKRLHRSAWTHASGFADVVQGDAQILCAPHGQQAGRLWRMLMSARLGREMRALREEEPTRLTPVQRRVLGDGPVLRPVTLHQKFAIADGRRCVIGGLDPDERRIDAPSHDHPAEQTRHDVSVLLKDLDFCGALRSHFADCWNAAIACDAAPLADRPEMMDASARPQSRSDLRLLRTFAAPCPGATRISPVTRVAEHEAALVRLFTEARDHIHIETQGLRHSTLVDALCGAAITAPDLQLVIILPAAPGHAVLDGDNSWNARHGQWLQDHAIDRLNRAFGHRLAALCPASGETATGGLAGLDPAPNELQSRVTIVDDKVAVIGSADLNGRSMRRDSEASVLIRDAAFARGLQRTRAGNWLGERLGGQSPTMAATWVSVASADKDETPRDRPGLLRPYPIGKTPRFSRWLRLLPDDMF